MRAAYYDRQGPSAEVLQVGEMPMPEPVVGEVRVRVAASGVNPGDIKKRQDTLGVGMPYARVIPHSDGAGEIDAVGAGVAAARIGERVWCFGAQSYRAFGTAAEFVTVPASLAVPLPSSVSFDQGACLGIPGITAHRAVHVAGPVAGRTVLVQGGSGAVGQAAIALAQHAGANVIATVRAVDDHATVERAGTAQVVVTRGLEAEQIVEQVREFAPDGIDHIIEVAFDANVDVDAALLRQGGSIATYASGRAAPTVPFWPLVFQNVSLFFLGSDDFPAEAKAAAARGLNDALAAEWSGFEIALRYPLADIAGAHAAIEQRRVRGRVVVEL